MHQEDVEKIGKNRIAFVMFASIFLVVMVVVATVSIGRRPNNGKSEVDVSSQSHDQVSASMKAIKTVCQPTDYQKQCVESLQTESGNTTDPKELIRAAFQVAKKHVAAAAKRSRTLKQLEKDPRASLALEDCNELMDEAIEDLQRSFEELGKSDHQARYKMGPMINNLKTWLSSTITYQETCLDGFANTTGEAGVKMREILKTSIELTINAIAMVSKISSILGNLDINREINLGSSHHRGLIENNAKVLGHGGIHVLERGDLYPSWLGPRNRRLLGLIDQAQFKPDVVVAKDGSGNCTTINEALNFIPKKSNKTTTIYIKEGIYQEKVYLNRSMARVFMIGDGMYKTRITGNLNYVDGTPTMHTATVSVLGEFLMAKNIGFENSAGPEKHQAVALRVDADMSIFYNCSMDGYQDTLYTHAKRQYYRDCTITGTIDFIFGDGSAFFQNCKIIVRKPLDNQHCIVTAQGRNVTHQPTAIVIQNSSIIADHVYWPVRNKIKSYLGRPWRIHSRTVIMETFIDDLIQPQGWLPWEGEFGIHTCFYAEYGNYGPGANKTGRVTWQGVKSIDRLEEAFEFTAGKFFDGDDWIKPRGVPYVSGFVTN